MVYFDRSVPIKPSEFKTSISVESYNEKTTENYWNYYVAEKHTCTWSFQIIFQTIKDMNPK